jgi:hypothetical protein
MTLITDVELRCDITSEAEPVFELTAEHCRAAFVFALGAVPLAFESVAEDVFYHRVPKGLKV